MLRSKTPPSPDVLPYAVQQKELPKSSQNSKRTQWCLTNKQEKQRCCHRKGKERKSQKERRIREDILTEGIDLTSSQGIQIKSIGKVIIPDQGWRGVGGLGGGRIIYLTKFLPFVSCCQRFMAHDLYLQLALPAAL